MREILFRGKLIATKEWAYGGYFICNETPCFHEAFKVNLFDEHTEYYPANHEVDLATIGQFTGFYDKNHNKIFEGDLIKTFATGNVYEVKFGHCSSMRYYGWFAERKGKQFALGGIELGQMNTVEVIGNIHEQSNNQ